MAISDTVRFWVYLTLLIPSIICLLFILYHFLSKRRYRNALNNHVILIVLVISLISEVTVCPWMLYFYKFSSTWKRSLIFCELWGFLEWGMYVTRTMVFAWATIERHILIFHDKWVSTKRRRLFIHYLPLLLLCLYCVVFYMIVYFFPTCKNYMYNSDMVCIDPCLFYNYIFSMWELIVHQIIPAVIIIVFSVALFVRVLWKKCRIRQPVHWRKHRKMTVQVLTLSVLYSVFFFPFVAYNIMLTLGISTRRLRDFVEISEFFYYCLTPLLPCACVLSLPKLRATILKILNFRQRTTHVGPVTFTMRTSGGRTIATRTIVTKHTHIH